MFDIFLTAHCCKDIERKLLYIGRRCCFLLVFTSRSFQVHHFDQYAEEYIVDNRIDRTDYDDPPPFGSVLQNTEEEEVDEAARECIAKVKVQKVQDQEAESVEQCVHDIKYRCHKQE